MNYILFGIIRFLLIIISLIFIFSSIFPIDCYVYTGYRWPGTSRLYYINIDSFINLPSLSPLDILTDIQLAADIWNNQSNANIKWIYGGTTNIATITPNSGKSIIYIQSGVSPSGVLAESRSTGSGSYRISSHIAIYAGSTKWYTYSSKPPQLCANNGYYLMNTAVHEFGHSLGFVNIFLYKLLLFSYYLLK